MRLQSLRRTPLPPPDQKEILVQKMFSSIAHYYDLNNTLLSLGLHHQWKEKTVHLAGLRSGEKVVDVGSGTADLAKRAADQVGASGWVAAVDLNEPMLRIGQQKVSRYPWVSCLAANGERLPLRDAVADAVLTGFCLRNVAHLNRALNEIFRILKPNGRMVCLEFSKPSFPLLRRLYDFYSFTVLPALGTWVSRDRTGVYQYLPASIRQFPDQERFSEQLRQTGFREVSYINRAFGIVAIHTGWKSKNQIDVDSSLSLSV